MRNTSKNEVLEVDQGQVGMDFDMGHGGCTCGSCTTY